MFERRLKVFLGVLLLVTLTLVMRAAQVQVLQHKEWELRAAETMTRSEQTETTRGVIRDYKGVAIAMDEPCVDACLDYRVLSPNPDKNWVTEVARARLRDRLGSAYTDAPLDQRKVMVAKEVEQVRDDVRQLIPRLARISGRSERELEDVRLAVVEKVKMRRRFLWYNNYERALRKHEKGVKDSQTRPSSVWQKWLLDEGDDPPELDSFELRVSEETARHVVIRDIDLDVQTELGKHSDRFPGLELRTGNRRIYPLGTAGAHLLGRMSKVTKSDIEKDPNFGDELRQYLQTDLKGRGGLEELCEPMLRGVRGEVAHVEGREVARKKPQPGHDVYTSIDIELQQQVESLFQEVPIKTLLPGGGEIYDRVAMHGAAVVIDVATGELRVLASAPSFDPNSFEEKYAELTNSRNLTMPLLNRATQALREPGSTIKPIVGIAGVASGIRRPDEGYECTGYMMVNGRPFPNGRCWVNSMFHKMLCSPDCRRFPCPAVAHHPIGNGVPHPTGFLTLPDALERSCNPYFESIAHTLGPVRLSDWYRKFGLGMKTDIGIPEERGRLPDSNRRTVTGPSATFSTWSAGIGQGPVNVTPIQMANVATTIARGGVWVRPSLLRQNYPQGAQGQIAPAAAQTPDRVDLGLPPQAIRAVREGMFRVVHNLPGSGGAVRRADVAVAGKTGTAEAAWLKVEVRDFVTGKTVMDEKGKPVMELLALSTHDAPNPKAPWYRGTGREGGRPHHSWFIGYAPAENPQIAFAVMVEYGGSGGGAAGSVASKVVELCIAHDYLKLAPKGEKNVAAATLPAATSLPIVATPLAPATEVELLHDVPATARAAN